MRVSIRNYGEYSSGNYGAHCQEVNIGNMALYFSYKTVIAFSSPETHGLLVSENCWQSTTGKHLNWIDSGNKKARLPREQFEEKLNQVLVAHGLEVA